MMGMRNRVAFFAAVALPVVLLLSSARPSAAQTTVSGTTEAATVAAVVGGAELQRAGGGEWQLVVVGSSLFAGDRVRTRPNSRLKLVFRDDSIVDVGPGTEVVVAGLLFNPDAGEYRTAIGVVTGKLRALVSEYYRAPNSRYEIETPTAVAGVRGTEFVVFYEPNAEYTDVVGIEAEVEVEGKLGVVGGSVIVGPQTATRVQKGRFPSAPRRIDDALFRQYLEGLEIIGTGGRDSLRSAHPAVRGTLLSQADALGGRAGEVEEGEPTRGLVVGAPDQPFSSYRSNDVSTNTQPLLEYQAVPPGVPPTGRVRVGF
jgi:hypothetical protein